MKLRPAFLTIGPAGTALKAVTPVLWFRALLRQERKFNTVYFACQHRNIYFSLPIYESLYYLKKRMRILQVLSVYSGTHYKAYKGWFCMRISL
jgi:hypothetical protein